MSSKTREGRLLLPEKKPQGGAGDQSFGTSRLPTSRLGLLEKRLFRGGLQECLRGAQTRPYEQVESSRHGQTHVRNQK